MRPFCIIQHILFLFLTIAVTHSLASDTGQKKPVTDQAEQELIQIIDLINRQKLDDALKKSEQSLKKYPNFKLLSAVYADLLYGKYNELEEPFTIAENQLNKENYIKEVNARLQSSSNLTQLHQNHIPDFIRYIDKTTPYFFVIDFSKSRLYLFENNADNIPQLIADHYVTIGARGYNKQVKGDNKTPIGIYHVTSFLHDNQLPELYGWGAFPINYPNGWDKLNKRTGSGIWLHGVPRNTYSRPPQDSKGCLVISNDILINISRYLKINTPVILTPSINWIDKKHFRKTAGAFKAAFLKWKEVWQNKNINAYLKLYSKSFNNNKKDYKAWARHKRRVFAKSKNISIKIEQLSIISYPGEKDMLSVSFYQHYKSNNYRSSGYKHQYWKKESDGHWRIIYEYAGL